MHYFKVLNVHVYMVVLACHKVSVIGNEQKLTASFIRKKTNIYAKKFFFSFTVKSRVVCQLLS